MKPFTINQLITEFEKLQILKPNEVWRLEVGIRAARSYWTLYKKECLKTKEVLPNGKEIEVNLYPFEFRARVHKIIKNYLKAVQNKSFITTREYNTRHRDNNKQK